MQSILSLSINAARALIARSQALTVFSAIVVMSATVATAAVDEDLRILPQITAGTAGFEPGVALEWRSKDLKPVIVRPEVFISEDGRPGGGAALLYDATSVFDLRRRQSLAIGPRAVYHNSDESGWEVDAMATWTIELSGSHRPWEHAVGVLGALGVRHDKEENENDIGATGGAFYSYRF
jgi:hypothetical protein